MVSLAAAFAAASDMLPSIEKFRSPDAEHRPETWFHLIGQNISKEGISADIRAIAEAGIGGVQLFHGSGGKGMPERWPGTSGAVKCLSPEWDELIAFVANACSARKLGFTLQNCPGWATSGGPWISPSNSMRGLKFVRADVVSDGKSRIVAKLPVPSGEPWRDWRDIAVVAFPSLNDDSGEYLAPVSVVTNGASLLYVFDRPVTIRSLVLPAPRHLNSRFSYRLDTSVRFEAVDGTCRTVAETEYPTGCWLDEMPFTLSCRPETSAKWRLTVSSPHKCDLSRVLFSAAARMDNWEGLAGWTLRGGTTNRVVEPDPSGKIDPDRLKVFPADAISNGEFSSILPSGRWTVLRFAHVNLGETNGPAPEEATGWECDKFDPRGAEAHFAAYAGRLADGPLAGRGLKGVLIDSWECARQTWTARMPEFFRAKNGYDVLPRLPALLGYVVGDTASTKRFLSDWRRTTSELVEKNYYRRMAELAHAKGLSISWEMSFGHVLPGDPLAYYSHADVPVCEFWQPFGTDGGVSDNDFNPVRPCSSAAHLYGKRRSSAEAFPSLRLTWHEDFNLLKSVVDRRYGYGVTHCLLHTYTHNPRIDLPPPGSSLDRRVGTPFSRLQTWWRFMPGLTDYLSRCSLMLEAGRPVVDVLLYLGDDPLHIPSEDIAFPHSCKYDYLNRDALFNRLSVRNGRLVAPGGAEYRAIWLPERCEYGEETAARFKELEKAGIAIVRGSPLFPWAADLECEGRVNWYHRTDGNADWYFISAPAEGFEGEISFRKTGDVEIYDPVSGAVRPAVMRNGKLFFDLSPAESIFVVFREGALKPVEKSVEKWSSVLDGPWKVCFDPGWGAPAECEIASLVPWRSFPEMDEEGRAYSGTARYCIDFTVPSAACGAGKRISIDLGKVVSFAEVEVNGHPAATLWCRPYRCDITSLIRPGVNTLTVKVTSPWGNRLTFDAGRPEQLRKTWTQPWPHSKRPLEDYGMTGPVVVSVTEGGSGETMETVKTGPSRTDLIRSWLSSSDRKRVFSAMHRGDCRNYPENSLDAVRSCIALGAEIVELDIKRTKDGRFVVIHDRTLDRTTNGKGEVSTFTFEEIRRLRLRERQGGEGSRITSSRVPSLEEVLALAHGKVLVNIDNIMEYPREIIEAIVRAGAVRDVIVKARFSPDEAKRALGPYWRLVESGELIFMPVMPFFGANREVGIRNLDLWLAEEKRECFVYEMCFSSEDEMMLRTAKVRSARNPPRIWVNTLTDRLGAGFGEVDFYTISARTATRLAEPDIIWGRMIDAGATVIQTDYAAELMVYLYRSGRK